LECKKKVFDFVTKRNLFLFGSALVAIACIILAVIPGGLKYGVDFKAGISITLGPKEGETLTLEQVRNKLAELGQSQASVQQLEESDFFIRIGELNADEQIALRSGLEQIATVQDFESVSAAVASKTARNAAIASGVAVIAMLLYIALAFRRVQNPLRYGTAAVIALMFNLLLTVGVFALMGRTRNWEIDPLFITALLAIIGYSVNDTIVVLDRVRENLTKGMKSNFETTVNLGINQTIARSLNTATTTVLAVLAIYLVVGGPISHFLIALFIGIVAGTYSSIFIASQLLVVWEGGEWGSLIPRIPRRRRVEG
jgi:preprotein translocase subunit SecF